MPRSTTIWPPPAQSTWPTSRTPFAELILSPLLTIAALLPCSAAEAYLTMEETNGITTRHVRQARRAGRPLDAHGNDKRESTDAGQALHQARATRAVRLLACGDHRRPGQDHLARWTDRSDGLLRQVASW